MYGDLDHGFRFWDSSWYFLTENDIFRYAEAKTSRIVRIRAAITVFFRYQGRSYVVHKVHGIGRYIGVENVEVSGVHRDYLLIAYAGNDKLYVPVDQKYLCAINT